MIAFDLHLRLELQAFDVLVDLSSRIAVDTFDDIGRLRNRLTCRSLGISPFDSRKVDLATHKLR